jgi:hypothetical protein
MKQRLYYRRSKKGRVFRAGRGTVKRSSQLRRDQIRKDINVSGPYRGQIIKIMEKDPLLWKEYKLVERPTIKLTEGFLKKTDKFAEVNFEDNSIEMEPSILNNLTFEREKGVKDSDFYRADKIIDSSVSVKPKEILSHELQHLKDKKHTYTLDSLKNISEDAAFWRSQFDIRKFKKPQKMQDVERSEAFNGPILKESL